MRYASVFRTDRRAPLLQALKSALAVVLAWLVASLILHHGQPPLFAAIGALLVVQPSLNQSFAKGVERSVGVIAGVVIASGLALLFGTETWVVLVAVALALLVAWALRLTPGAAAQVGITVLLVMTMGQTTPEYAVDRIWETLLGVAVGFAVNLALVPPVAIRPAVDAVDALVGEAAASLERLAGALTVTPSPQQRVELIVSARLLRPMQDRARASITQARDSLALNPRAGRHRERLVLLEETLVRITPIVNRTVAMTRSVVDLGSEELAAEPSTAAIREQLLRAAHDVRLLAAPLTADRASAIATEEPALTSQLMLPRPSHADWILIGSMLVDLQRIHAVLAGDDDPIADAGT